MSKLQETQLLTTDRIYRNKTKCTDPWRTCSK